MAKAVTVFCVVTSSKHSWLASPLVCKRVLHAGMPVGLQWWVQLQILKVLTLGTFLGLWLCRHLLWLKADILQGYEIPMVTFEEGWSNWSPFPTLSPLKEGCIFHESLFLVCQFLVYSFSIKIIWFIWLYNGKYIVRSYIWCHCSLPYFFWTSK